MNGKETDDSRVAKKLKVEEYDIDTLVYKVRDGKLVFGKYSVINDRTQRFGFVNYRPTIQNLLFFPGLKIMTEGNEARKGKIDSLVLKT